MVKTSDERLNDDLGEDEPPWVDNITLAEFRQYRIDMQKRERDKCKCGGFAFIGGRIKEDGVTYPTVYCSACFVETEPAITFSEAHSRWRKQYAAVEQIEGDL
jgi:hypothetical protein